MKYTQPVALWVIGAALLALFSCNDPTVIGSDLLSGDQLDINFTDSVTFTSYVQKEDSVLTYDPNPFATAFQSFPCGEFIDPVFGKTTASISAGVLLGSKPPNFSGATLDSMVLILPWQSGKVYGKIDELYTLEVFELQEKLFVDSTYYSNRQLAIGSSPIGSYQFTPKPGDSVQVIIPDPDSLRFQKLPPHLRIKLDDAFSQQFFEADSLNFASDTAFLKFFKGFHVKAASQNGGMLSFNLYNALAGISVYFHRDSNFTTHVFPVSLTNVATAQFKHNYEGTLVENFIGKKGEVSDSLIFIQGMSGVNTVLEFPYVQTLGDIIVNKAELEFTIMNLPQDDMAYTSIDQIVVSEIVNDTTFVDIVDVISTRRIAQNDFYRFFGGNPSGGKYKLNISAHFQDMIRGVKSNKLLVRVYFKPEKTSRVVLGGPSHSISPAKLNLSFTKF
jgi:hypothetical protein